MRLKICQLFVGRLVVLSLLSVHCLSGVTVWLMRQHTMLGQQDVTAES